MFLTEQGTLKCSKLEGREAMFRYPGKYGLDLAVMLLAVILPLWAIYEYQPPKAEEKMPEIKIEVPVTPSWEGSTTPREVVKVPVVGPLVKMPVEPTWMLNPAIVTRLPKVK
jgi:hypothetical protein